MNRTLQAALHRAQRAQLWLLLGAYALAALFPGPGLRMRDLSAGSVPWVQGGSVRISLMSMMLAFLLLNAGFGVQARELKHLHERLRLLGAGLAANVLVPVAFAFVIALLLALWPEDDERQNILVGLALIGSMPIAASSTAWSQNAGGNLALSLGLVLGSTLGSPLLTPVSLHLIGRLVEGDYADDLHELADRGSIGFLVIAVITPSALGVLLQGVLRPSRRAAALPVLRLINLLDLLLLNYANASGSLPQVLHRPDGDFLLVTLVIVTSLCVLSFALGGLIARRVKASEADRLALMFGLGMSNNGTAMVLASIALPDHPRVMLPIVFYTLVQQIVAGIVDRRARRGPPASRGHGREWRGHVAPSTRATPPPRLPARAGLQPPAAHVT